MSSFILHLSVALPLLISSLPIPKSVTKHVKITQTHLHHAQIAAHALLGILLILVPSALLACTVEGDFNDLHIFMQSYIGIFHLSISYFLFRHGDSPQSRPFIFPRLLSAAFSLFTRLFAAWHLSEKSTRGLLISDHFVSSSLIIDGVWLAAELIRFVRSQETAEDKINDLCAATTRWAEGKGSSYLENALYIDSFICFGYALFHFAFPQNILKLVIRSNLDLDSHHYMWCRLFGALWLTPSLSSLAAIHALPSRQIAHLAARLVIQAGLFVLHIWGHWIDPIYSPNHITAFMVSGFFLSFHISTYYRFNKLFGDEPRTKVMARVEIKKTK